RQQRGDVGVPLVDVLHQQGPVAFAQRREQFFGEGAGLHLPGVVGAIVADQPREREFLAGQAGEVLGFDRRDETREGAADQQRALLPVIAQELRWWHAQALARLALDFGGRRAAHGVAPVAAS